MLVQQARPQQRQSYGEPIAPLETHFESFTQLKPERVTGGCTNVQARPETRQTGQRMPSLVSTAGQSERVPRIGIGVRIIALSTHAGFCRFIPMQAWQQIF